MYWPGFSREAEPIECVCKQKVYFKDGDHDLREVLCSTLLPNIILLNPGISRAMSNAAIDITTSISISVKECFIRFIQYNSPDIVFVTAILYGTERLFSTSRVKKYYFFCIFVNSRVCRR